MTTYTKYAEMYRQRMAKSETRVRQILMLTVSIKGITVDFITQWHIAFEANCAQVCPVDNLTTIGIKPLTIVFPKTPQLDRLITKPHD